MTGRSLDCAPELEKAILPKGARMSMSLMRADLTGPMTSGIVELKIAMKRVRSHSTSVT